MNSAELIEKMTRRASKKKTPIKASDYLSSGSTMVNLAATGHVDRCFVKGKSYFFVGDSGSGKTFICLTSFAEATINPSFDDYLLIYDNPEDGALMDLRKFFGAGVAKRLQAPGGTRAKPVFSRTSEDYYYFVDDYIEAGVPFIYILDSMDALDTDADEKKFRKQKKARKDNANESGSYGTAKARMNSSRLGSVIHGLKETGSILITIHQTRDNIGGNAMFQPKTRSGGHAVKFYASLEMWTSIKGRKYKTAKGKRFQVGIDCKVKIKKNRIDGKEWDVVVPIYRTVGIDDIGGCIEWLGEMKHWPCTKGVYRCPELKMKGRIESIIKRAQDDPEVIDIIKQTVQTVWQEIEEATFVERPSKYG